MVCQDLPDYTRKVTIEYTGGFIGLEELAARLGSIVPWDMRGNVHYMEDFETEETEWQLTDWGTLSTIARSTRRKHSGNWSIKSVVDSEANARTAMTRELFHPGASKWALLVMFCLKNDAQDIEVYFDSTTAGRNRRARLRYRMPTTTLSIYGQDTLWHDIATDVDFAEGVYIWFPFIMIFDEINEVWDKIIIAGTEYPLANVPIFAQDTAIVGNLTLTIWQREIGVVGFTSYVDTVVLASNVQ